MEEFRKVKLDEINSLINDEKVCGSIEESVFLSSKKYLKKKKCLEIEDVYNHKINTIITNNLIINKINNSEIDFSNYNKKDIYNFLEFIYEPIINKKNKNKLKQYYTEAFKCFKCKQNKCTYYEKQTRSADEPMTLFITCTYCDNKWKQ